MDDKPLTQRTDDSLGSLLDAFQNLNIDQEPENNPFTNFYQRDDMVEAAPVVKKTKLNPPEIFTGKLTDLQILTGHLCILDHKHRPS